MGTESFSMVDGKVVIRLTDQVCDTSERLLTSQLFYRVLYRCISDLSRKNSSLMEIFDHDEITGSDIHLLIDTLRYLAKLPADLIPKIVPGSEGFFRDPLLLNSFVEHLYNYWRHLQRLVVVENQGTDQRPYRTFRDTVETLTHVVRGAYRDIQENITGNHPRIYRQVSAGAEIAAIALPADLSLPDSPYQKLAQLPVIRQVLIYPPLIFNPPMNKRSGAFQQVDRNPLDHIELNKEDWLCYPARVGSLLILIYFSMKFFELGFSLCNLFELADEEVLKTKPDAVFVYGVPDASMSGFGKSPTIFYDDAENDLLVGAIPERNEFGYFGYLKKMALTLHNIKMMKMGRMPFHGALVHLVIRGKGGFTVLIMGDTGAGKSETLEALRTIGGDDLEEVVIIADDMGSLKIDDEGNVMGYGTETGAFVRLDDLQTGYAFGQIDRTIIMSPDQTNARVVLPVSTYDDIIKGYPIDFVLYANNYETVGEGRLILEQFNHLDEALNVFRAGKVMSKGTTTKTGLVQSFYANVFGPQQYPEQYESLAHKYFSRFFDNRVFVGQLRTQLGIPGKEHTGPLEAARFLLGALQRRGKNYHPPAKRLVDHRLPFVP